MANKRIKDLATTASSAASDDFMALDGVTNGTRKMSAANPSVTTLTTSGVITPGGSVHGANGALGNPSFAFASDQDTGLYRIGANNIGVVANGAKVLDIATTGLTVTGALGASSLTAPASIDLTLAGGSSGASLVLGQGASGSITSTASRVGADYSDTLTNSSTSGNASCTRYAFVGASWAGLSRFGPSHSLPTYANKGALLSSTGIIISPDASTNSGGTNTVDIIVGGFSTATPSFRFGPNLLIGGTTDITGNGGLKVYGTTAASSTTTGALQVAGGVGVAGAGHFGSNVVSSGYFSAAPGTGDFRFNQQSFQRAAFAMGGSHIGYGYNSRYDGSSATVPATDSTGTMSSIASTASGISIFTNTSQVANTPGVERLSVSSAGLVNVTGTMTVAGTTFQTSGSLRVRGGIEANAATTNSLIQFADGATFQGNIVATSASVLRFTAGTGMDLLLAARDSSSGLTITTGGAATFAGAVTVGGALKLANAYVATPVVSTGYVTIQDSNGTTYKVAVSL